MKKIIVYDKEVQGLSPEFWVKERFTLFENTTQPIEISTGFKPESSCSLTYRGFGNRPDIFPIGNFNCPSSDSRSANFTYENAKINDIAKHSGLSSTQESLNNTLEKLNQASAHAAVSILVDGKFYYFDPTALEINQPEPIPVVNPETVIKAKTELLDYLLKKCTSTGSGKPNAKLFNRIFSGDPTFPIPELYKLLSTEPTTDFASQIENLKIKLDKATQMAKASPANTSLQLYNPTLHPDTVFLLETILASCS